MFALLKLILNFFCGEPKLPLNRKVGPSTRTIKLFLGFSAWDDELLSTPKVVTFLKVSLLKLYESALSISAISFLYPYFLLS